MSAVTIASHTVSWPQTRLTAFLRRAVEKPRFLWESDRAQVSFAAFGAAIEVVVREGDPLAAVRGGIRAVFENARMTRAENVPDAAARMRFVGGFSFRPAGLSENGVWAGFPAARFTLPEYMLSRIGDDCYLTVNVQTDAQNEWAAQEALWELPAPLDIPVEDLSPIRVLPVDLMGRVQWQDIVSQAVATIHRNQARKIVLARAREFPAYANPVVSISRLAGLYPDCYQFLLEPEPGRAFFGATPELLFSKSRDRVETMALAGSIRRGETVEEDEALADRLLKSDKDTLEHTLVVQDICEKLDDLLSERRVADRRILKLSNIQHLFTPISGRMVAGVDLFRLIERMHPTPAVGGLPSETALEFIAQAEPVSRGWYAGPVGWLDDAGDGEFAVALRSAVSQDRRTRLYAGAGIVGRSEPEREWQETEWKFRPMMEALGCV